MKTEQFERKVAVLIPCRNEEATVADVVAGFRSSLPDADVYVYDNASTDETPNRALEAGAEVLFEPLEGKGRVVRRMFSDIEADVYIIADGDGTYDPSEAPILLKTLVDNSLDMVAGARIGISENAGRRGHAFGNRMFNRLYRALFSSGFSDILTGYRVLSRKLVKSFPAVSTGFEIETELAVHTSQLQLPTLEVPVTYGARSEASTSKLRTFYDGLGILKAMVSLLKENRPFLMFGVLSTACFVTAVSFAIPLMATYFDTGLVPRLPTAVLVAGLTILGLLLLMSGLILDSVAKSRIEAKRLAYLQVSSRINRDF